MIDVIVVGGGPAGCHAARLLAEKGLDVHLLEEHFAIGEPVDCTGILGVEAIEKLNLPESIKLGPIGNLSLNSPTGSRVPFSSPSPLAWVVDRCSFDRVLARRAVAAGVSIHLGTRVQDLIVGEDGVRVIVAGEPKSCRRSSGVTQINASMVIVAGGPRYRIQTKLGMGRPKDFLKTAQVEIPARGLDQTRVFVGSKIAPGSFAWTVPFNKNGRQFARVGVSAKSAGLPYLKNLLQRLKADGLVDEPAAPIRSWIIPISPLSRTYAHRVLAVGDAAGQVKPITGGGIYYGILCAEAAADIAASGFERSNLSAGFLAHYQKEWRKKIGLELRASYLFRTMTQWLSDQDMDDVIEAVRSDKLLALAQKKVRFDWHKDLILQALRSPALGQALRRKMFRSLNRTSSSRPGTHDRHAVESSYTDIASSL